MSWPANPVLGGLLGFGLSLMLMFTLWIVTVNTLSLARIATALEALK